MLTRYRISHEIRNPLSAVLHCAENIMDAVKGGEAKSDSIAVDEIVDAVHTIQLCVDHQVSRVTTTRHHLLIHVAENSCR
jgi:signal transduction histidine kinase